MRMNFERPDRAKIQRVWLLLGLSLVTWIIHQCLVTRGAGLWPLSGSTIAAAVGIGSALYLIVHYRSGRADDKGLD